MFSWGSNLLKHFVPLDSFKVQFTCWYSPVNNFPLQADSEPRSKGGKGGSALPRPLHSSRLLAYYVRGCCWTSAGTSSGMIGIKKKLHSYPRRVWKQAMHSKWIYSWMKTTLGNWSQKGGSYNTAQRVCTFLPPRSEEAGRRMNWSNLWEPYARD